MNQISPFGVLSGKERISGFGMVYGGTCSPKPFVKFVVRPRFLSSPSAAARSRFARGLDRNLGRERTINEWA